MVRTKQTSKSTKQGGVSNKAGRKIISSKRVASKPALKNLQQEVVVEESDKDEEDEQDKNEDKDEEKDMDEDKNEVISQLKKKIDLLEGRLKTLTSTGSISRELFGAA
jgi:hypothetical protein